MKIHDRKLHVLLTMEAFSKYVIIYAFLQKRLTTVRMERILFYKKVPCKKWENTWIKKFRSLKSVFQVNLLNQINSVENI